MDYIANEIRELRESLMHYGVGIDDGAPGRGSGRYPKGSGENPFQHSTGDFLDRIEKLHKQGLSEKQIADALEISTTELRKQKAIAKAERRNLERAKILDLQAKGMNPSQIARELGYAHESSVRALLNEQTAKRASIAENTAEFIKKQVDEKGYIDVGKGVELYLGVSDTQFKKALTILENQGYKVFNRGVQQVTNPNQQTVLKVIAPPGTEYKNVYDDLSKIQSMEQYTSRDGGLTFDTFHYPSSMDSSRLSICYAEEGGEEKDGLIEIRRGCKDLSLGEAHYAQVRILVDNDKYLKGMAVYSDDLPDGVDVRFNTNKHVGTPKADVLKPVKKDKDGNIDRENPFGSLIKANGQSFYDDPNGEYTDPVTGKRQSLSLINKRAEEGDWGEWSKTLPSQFLAKQPQKLIESQLKLAKADKEAEFEEICSLTNPAVKQRLLKSYADDCDSAAVHLKAAALPRQSYQVILPVPSMKDNECYAPNYKDGEKVVLIRYPHGGTFEIPTLTVNNKQAEARKMMGGTNAVKDVVGINSKVAGILSGADFDGDTVMVIPLNSKIKIATSKPLEGLKGFDPKAAYPEKSGMRLLSETNKQKQMGVVSNLITDMTLGGATPDELARAVRHSMVIIDATKHHLDYKQSAIDNGIASLHKKYQGKASGGASTLISSAKSPYRVDKRQGSPRINQKGKEWYDPSLPEGALVYKTANDAVYTKTIVNKRTGEVTTKEMHRTQEVPKMSMVNDARKLSSGTPQEEAYADYANSMKSLAIRARQELISTPNMRQNSSAKALYKDEVASLDEKLKKSLMNAPRERYAQIIANSQVEAKKKTYDLSKEEIKKEGQRALKAARERVGAERTLIDITDREWEAIQAGAISHTKLANILDHADLDAIRQRATPRTMNSLSDAKIGKLKSLAASGYSTAEIAESLGVSTTTVSKYLNSKGE